MNDLSLTTHLGRPSSDIVPDDRPSRFLPLAGLMVGAIGGAAFGAAFRAWMRFVSDDPEFSWSGTLIIVGAFTAAYAGAGLLWAGRRRGWKALMIPARIIVVLLSLACFGGAGLVMFPTIILGALAMARTDWPRALRIVFAALAGLSMLLVAGQLLELGWLRAGTATALYLVIVAVEIRVFAEMHRPTLRRGVLTRKPSKPAEFV